MICYKLGTHIPRNIRLYAQYASFPPLFANAQILQPYTKVFVDKNSQTADPRANNCNFMHMIRLRYRRPTTSLQQLNEH